MVLENLAVGLHGPLLQLAWCAQDHVLAMCSYGANNPVLVYYHDPNVPSQQLVPTPASAQPVPAQVSARQPQSQAPTEAGGANNLGSSLAAAALLARVRAQPAVGDAAAAVDSGRVGSAVRRERRTARRSGNVALEQPSPEAASSGLASRVQPPAPLATDAAVQGDVMSARRKAAAAARRALAGPTTPVSE